MVESNTPWCATRTHLNSSSVLGEYGNCSPHCLDTSMKVESLADDKFKTFWDQNLFRLFTDDIGHCHTYSPIHESSTGHDNKFMAFLGELCRTCKLKDIPVNRKVLLTNLYVSGNVEDNYPNYYYTG